LRVFELKSNREHASFEFPSDPDKSWAFFRFSPNGRLLAVNTGTREDGEVTIWDLHEKKRHLVLGGVCPGFAFAPDGMHLAVAVPKKNRTAAEKAEFRVYELVNGELCGKYLFDKPSITGHVTFSPDGATLCAEFGAQWVETTHIGVWDVKSQRQLFSFRAADNPRFLPDGKTLVLQCTERHVFVNTATWKERTLAPVGAGNTAYVSASAELRSNHVTTISETKVMRFEFLACLKSGAADGSREERIETVNVEDARTGTMIASIQFPERVGATPFLTPDDSTLLIRKRDDSGEVLEVWDLPPSTTWPRGVAAVVVLTAVFSIGLWFIWRIRSKLSDRKLASSANHAPTPTGKPGA
jgi:hypothetical protein